jgi:hypothetical protein
MCNKICKKSMHITLKTCKLCNTICIIWSKACRICKLLYSAHHAAQITMHYHANIRVSPVRAKAGSEAAARRSTPGLGDVARHSQEKQHRQIVAYHEPPSTIRLRALSSDSESTLATPPPFPVLSRHRYRVPNTAPRLSEGKEQAQSSG